MTVHTTAPSRDFMVQQAVLNAAAAEYPWGPIDALRLFARVSDSLDPVPGNFIVGVHREYRRIAAQYRAVHVE